MRFFLNRSMVEADPKPGLTALDYIRDAARLTGTKAGCREGDCGSCTVLLGRLKNGSVGYGAVNSCLLPMGAVDGCQIVTIEGLNREALSPIQQAIVDLGASQCGFCSPGIVVSLTGMLINEPKVDESSIAGALDGNICRCTGYASIRRAAEALEGLAAKLPGPGPQRIARLVEERVLPDFLLDAQHRLESIRGADPVRKAGTSAIRIAGGTDGFVQKPRLLLDSEIEFLGGERLSEIRELDGKLSIGALTTMDEMAGSSLVDRYIPNFSRFVSLVGSPQIRRRATVGGNIVNASPIGDLSIMLLAVGAVLVIDRDGQSRTVPLAEFFKGYKKLDLEEGEIVARIEINPDKSRVFNFEKISKRKHLDIASVNSAISLTLVNGRLESVRMSAGGVSPVPLYLRSTSEYMNQKPPTWETALEASAIAEGELSPISDIRGSASYKRRLLKNLVLVHFQELFGATGELP